MLYGFGVMLILGMVVGAIVELVAHSVAFIFGVRAE